MASTCSACQSGDMTDPQVIKHYLDRIGEEMGSLTKWERDFVESLQEQFDERGRLSDRQAEILERIYADKTK